MNIGWIWPYYVKSSCISLLSSYCYFALLFSFISITHCYYSVMSITILGIHNSWCHSLIVSVISTRWMSTCILLEFQVFLSKYMTLLDSHRTNGIMVDDINIFMLNYFFLFSCWLPLFLFLCFYSDMATLSDFLFEIKS